MSKHTYFWSKIEKRSGKCWLWKASLDRHGYGQVRFNKRTQRAHRVAFELTKGKIPDGDCVLHSCDNPPCCNPAHLNLGSKKENTRQMMHRKRNGFGSLPGILNKNSKLNEKQIIQIRKLRMAGLKLRQISEIFKVTEANISYICKRKGWKHVS